MRYALVLFCLLLPASAAFAEKITISEAFQRGLKQNPQHLAAQADVTAARSAASLAASYRLPQLSFTEDLAWTNEPGTSLFISLNQQRLQLHPDADYYNDADTRSDFQSRLQLRQSLYDANLRYGWLIAEKQAEATTLTQRSSAELLALNLLNAYLDIQLAEAQQNWARVGVEESRELLRLARERESAGTGLKAERLNAEARLAESQQQLIGTSNRLQIAKWQLALQVGENEPVEIAAPVTEAQLPLEPSTSNDLRPDLAALGLQVEAAKLNSSKAGAGWQPQLYAGASWTAHDRDYPFSDSADSWLVNAGLSWTLFDGFGRQHAKVKATAEELGLRNRQRQALQQARIEQEATRLQEETLRKQLEATGTALVATEESYRLMRNRYQSGLSSLADLLTLQTRLEKMRGDLAYSDTRLLQTLGQQLFLQGQLSATLNTEDDNK